jgi:hypothetical protein
VVGVAGFAPPFVVVIDGVAGDCRAFAVDVAIKGFLVGPVAGDEGESSE